MPLFSPRRARSRALVAAPSDNAGATASSWGGDGQLQANPVRTAAHADRPRTCTSSMASTSLSSPSQGSPARSQTFVLRSSTRLSTWRRSRLKTADAESESLAAVPRRLRKPRQLQPPPTFVQPNAEASVTAFLSAYALPRDVLPESTDIAFKAHSALLRRVTLHRFDLDRYLFVYKPLAKAHAVLAMQLLQVVPIAQGAAGALTPLLRSAAVYVSANAHRSVYAMVLASQYKCAFKSRPASENILPDAVLNGEGLDEQQAAALDFIQQLSSDFATVSEDVKRRVIDGVTERDGHLERVISGVAAYVAFISRLSSFINLELSYEAVQFATTNLFGLPWKPSGGHFLIAADHSNHNDPFSLEENTGSARQRVSRLNRRSAKTSRSSYFRDKRQNVRRVSQFLTAQLAAPRMIADVQRSTENWMRTALLPEPGQLFEMNDLITDFWSFEPYYLSTSVMASEDMRRAFVLAAKELLFQEREVPKRTKFLLCYVLSRGAEKARAAARTERDGPPKESASRARARSLHSISSSSGTGVGSGSSLKADYDPLAIMTAHAAFLACRHGATPAELRAAEDASLVRAAMDGAKAHRNDGIVDADSALSPRDVAAAALAHSMVSRPARVEPDLLQCFEHAYGSPLKRKARGGRPCHRALLELVGAASLWGAFERYAAAALAFDVDMSTYLMFGNGRAEPPIIEFAQSPVGQDIGLSLHTDEVAEARARNEKAIRTSSIYHYSGSSPSLRLNAQRAPSLRRSLGSPQNQQIMRLPSLVPPRRRSKRRDGRER